MRTNAEDTAAHLLLRASGLAPSATEAEVLGRIYTCSRQMAELLQAVTAARYEQPATSLDLSSAWP